MKKTLSILLFAVCIVCMTSSVFAADEYSFDLQYDGTIVKNVEKEAKVLLIGQNATLHTNVKIKVDITGPATPKLLATDSSGVEHDIAQLGYWGPENGFAVQGDFTNTTPVKATFTEEGKYTITLSLIDVKNSDAVIATKTFTLEVYEDVGPVNNTITGGNMVNNVIEELPKTGTSIWEYAMYTGMLVVILSLVGMCLNKKKMMS